MEEIAALLPGRVPASSSSCVEGQYFVKTLTGKTVLLRACSTDYIGVLGAY